MAKVCFLKCAPAAAVGQELPSRNSRFDASQTLLSMAFIGRELGAAPQTERAGVHGPTGPANQVEVVLDRPFV